VTGVRKAPRQSWAVRGREAGNENAPGGPFPGAHNGFAIFPGGLQYEDVWRFPNIAFGDYVGEGEGFELLTEVHTSPGSSTAENWDVIREGVDPKIRPFALKFGNLRPRDAGEWFTSGWYGHTERPDSENVLWSLQGDYRYTWAALFDRPVGRNLFNDVKPFWEPQAQGGFVRTTNGPRPFGAAQSFRNWRSFVQASEMEFASDKVLFWEHFAWLSRNALYPEPVADRMLNLYFMPNAEIPVTLGDGSAVLIEPFDVMPNRIESSQSYYHGGWGTQLQYREGSGHATSTSGAGALHPRLKALIDVPFEAEKPFAWFIATDHGIRGRDLNAR